MGHGLYDDPQHYELLAQMTAPEDLPFYKRLVEERGGPVLELACGTGRIGLEIARGGTSVSAVDISQAMIDFAKARAVELGIHARFLLGDMRSFDLNGETYALILLPYNAFNHLYELEDVAAFIESVSRHMNAETRLVIDTFNPDPLKLVYAGSEARKILEFRDPISGNFVTLLETTQYDLATQINHITWSYEASGADYHRIDELSMRMFFPRELDALLTLHGLNIEQKLGDYDGSPFGSKRPKQIVVCRKK